MTTPDTVFVKRSRLEASVAEVFKWHARPGALERLSPPWDPLEVIRTSGGIETGAQTVMKIKAQPLPLKIKWVARHTAYEANRLFEDRQVQGPFARWTHTHQFEPDGPAACYLEDRVQFALPLHPLSRPFESTFILRKLERIFHYRHTTLIHDLADHATRSGRKPLHLLISGASGLVGSALIPFLTTGGHRVTRLVRRTPTGPDEIFWDPEAQQLDSAHLHGIDAVIHLSGENIGQGRWTPDKKRRIIASRNRTTALLAQTLSALRPPPQVMICASAIGFYGHRGDALLTEEDTCGADFISGVCNEWELAANAASEQGIRVVFLRIGVVLTPLGGALKLLLPPFALGLGAKFGRGEQYMSWIGMDDVLGSIYHAINADALQGPVNVVAPTPVTNAQFTRALGRTLSRPSLFTIPEAAIRAVFGQMGREVLLASTRVHPSKLLASGYRFRHPELQPALAHMLGR